MADVTVRGPVDFAVLVFGADGPGSAVTAAMVDLQSSGLVRVIDAVLVSRAADGGVVYAEVADSPVARQLDALADAHVDLLAEDDLEAIGESLDPGQVGLVLAWENTWAARLADAVAEAGGSLAAFERVPRDNINAALADDDLDEDDDLEDDDEDDDEDDLDDEDDRD